MLRTLAPSFRPAQNKHLQKHLTDQNSADSCHPLPSLWPTPNIYLQYNSLIKMLRTSPPPYSNPTPKKRRRSHYDSERMCNRTDPPATRPEGINTQKVLAQKNARLLSPTCVLAPLHYKDDTPALSTVSTLSALRQSPDYSLDNKTTD